QSFEPFQYPLMLTDHNGKQGIAQWIGHPLQNPEIILSPVRVVRGKSYKSPLCELGGKSLVCWKFVEIRIRIDHVFGQSFQAVLAHDDRTPFAFFYIRRND